MKPSGPNTKIVNTINDFIKKWSKGADKIVIGLDGPSGVGKTTIARELECVNNNITVASLEYFSFSPEKRLKAFKNNKDRLSTFENDWYDIDRLKKLISAFRTTTKPYIIKSKNFHSQKMEEKEYNFKNSILLVDGVFFHNTKIYNSIFDRTVYLTMDKKVLEERVKKRFIRLFSKDKLSVRMLWSQLFNLAWDQYVKAFKPNDNADLAVKIKVVKKY